MAEANNIDQLVQILTVRLDRQEKQQETTNDLLLRLVNQQEALFNLQQSFQKSQEKFNERQEGFNQRQEKFNERQEKANERQDQFNIIFLDEIRGMKKDIKDLTEVVLKQHEGRLKRLEDFMDDLMRKSG